MSELKHSLLLKFSSRKVMGHFLDRENDLQRRNVKPSVRLTNRSFNLKYKNVTRLRIFIKVYTYIYIYLHLEIYKYEKKF